MPYICLARTDIPDGTVQVLDLKPNASQLTVYDPPAQTRYINRVLNAIPVYKANGTATAAVSGLTAYIVDHVRAIIAGAPANSWTTTRMTAVAAAIIARLDSGAAMDLAGINTAIHTVLPLSNFNVAPSTGVVSELLSILAGRSYTLPAGALKFAGGVWSAGVVGSFTHPVTLHGTVMTAGEIKSAAIGGDVTPYENKPIRHTYDGTYFQVSLATGHLATFAAGVDLFLNSSVHDLSAPPQPYDQVKGARVVTVYADDGSLLA